MIAHFLAAPIFLASCLTLKLLFFLLIITLNLSKSVKLALFALRTNFFDCAEAAHFSPNLNVSAAFLLAKYKPFECNLLDCASSGSLEDTCYLHVCEGESLDWIENSGETGSWPVDEYSALISNVNNDYNLA